MKRKVLLAACLTTMVTASGCGAESGDGAPTTSSVEDAGTNTGTGTPLHAGLRLVLPDTLGSGRYSRDVTVQPSTTTREATQTLITAGVGNPVIVNGVYVQAGNTSGALRIDGAYGALSDPAKARDALLQVLAASEHSTPVPNTARTILPSGATEPLVCQVVSVEDQRAGATVTAPVCAWTDTSTTARVLRGGGNGDQTTGARIDLDAYAAEVDRIRAEIRIG
ncbi:hypothetical protein OG948_60620 (plasmid) [Embleya sp. NBC_00888]|uniref:hypothetical protein n=1 Tax=Embleya sp. NBC_00888 TaxID=2975960 RepID=UPI00386318EC|nr:hypothetical protein OG948_60620 [Embleya sp. NBC_00888]